MAGNGNRQRVVSSIGIPIVGQAKEPAKLASITFIQCMIIGRCGCGGDVVIQNFSVPGKCSQCKTKYWVNMVGYARAVDELAFNVSIGQEAADPADTAQGPSQPSVPT